MASKIAHKRKIYAKKFGCILPRYIIDFNGEFHFEKHGGTGKNKVNTVVIGIV